MSKVSGSPGAPLRWVVLGATVALGAGCSGDDDDGCVLRAACDITEPSCQAAVFAATACERGQRSQSMPPIRMQTVDGLRDEIAAESNEPSRNERAWSHGLSLLGLLAEASSVDTALTDVAVENLAAYYEPDLKRVTVVRRDTEQDPLDDVNTLSHEFVHSLQDADVDLTALRREWVTSTDSFVAINTLPEGEATLLSAAVTLGPLGFEPAMANWENYSNQYFVAAMDVIDAAPEPFFTAMQLLPYPVGLSALVDPWRFGGQASIDALYEKPRLSLLEWADPGSATPVPLDCYPTAPPTGFHGEDHDTLGITGVLGRLVSAGTSALEAYELAGAWRNDSVVLFTADEPSDATRAVAWRVAFAAAASAAAFQRAVEGLPSTTVVSDANTVTVYAASAPTVLDAWDVADACGAEIDLPVSNDDSPVAANAAWRRGRHIPVHVNPALAGSKEP